MYELCLLLYLQLLLQVFSLWRPSLSSCKDAGLYPEVLNISPFLMISQYLSYYSNFKCTCFPHKSKAEVYKISRKSQSPLWIPFCPPPPHSYQSWLFPALVFISWAFLRLSPGCSQVLGSACFHGLGCTSLPSLAFNLPVSHDFGFAFFCHTVVTEKHRCSDGWGHCEVWLNHRMD